MRDDKIGVQVFKGMFAQVVEELLGGGAEGFFAGGFFGIEGSLMVCLLEELFFLAAEHGGLDHVQACGEMGVAL
jgi:hypothetical protein